MILELTLGTLLFAFVLFPLPEFEFEEELFREPKKVQGFVALVKEKPFKKKRFKKVSKALPREVAVQRALRVADVTIAQSAKVRRTKKKVEKQPRPLIDLRRKFRKKKNVFIEKRRFAIDTISEKRELSVAKFLSQEKRGFFGQPRKRKRRRK